MSHFAAMKSPVPVAASATAADAKSPLFCPKPRRPVAPLRCHTDAGSGMDLLDLLLSKGEESSLSAASPLFCGSPPRRASNPVVRDSRFGMDCPPNPMPGWPAALLVPPVAAAATPAPVAVRPAAPPMSPRGAAGCARARFGFQPAAVRVEGFDCLDRGRGGRGHGIAAMA
ncbi:uncharacterized protein LOC100843912 [Brachypodium distachyon]|uniref:Uncharacterized protein n=1 Tax=Brachypodium distachyon TaxID=15368 RepID=I1IGS3_BRADI|nr:uncharacterized protein LOC100843912 [Brachypodium distachyon]KQJ85965.1 hypothetical protein BRADI_4g02630v3 [Brachypodium distachyon]|eukprot:XP_014757269.1 uncharacterized protein LOC100843912 [Brachypodium distachyon]